MAVRPAGRNYCKRKWLYQQAREGIHHHHRQPLADGSNGEGRWWYSTGRLMLSSGFKRENTSPARESILRLFSACKGKQGWGRATAAPLTLTITRDVEVSSEHVHFRVTVHLLLKKNQDNITSLTPEPEHSAPSTGDLLKMLLCSPGCVWPSSTQWHGWRPLQSPSSHSFLMGPAVSLGAVCPSTGFQTGKKWG